MQKFTTLSAIAAPLPIQNIDTDMIIPKQFLKTIKRTGLKEGLFYEMRFTVEGQKIEEFVLHREPYTHAQILVALENFGCGSSREHAPWALADFGITCVIAPSFADIFYNNCFKNGILPVVLPRDACDTLMQHAQSSSNNIKINLGDQTVEAGNHEFTFEIDPFRKHCLMNGLDDIGLTLEKADAITAYETKLKTSIFSCRPQIMDNMIPYILMIALVISHTIAIQFLRKRREAIDVSTPAGTAKAKQFGLIIAILYIEIPVITAIIWFVIAPMLAQSNH